MSFWFQNMGGSENEWPCFPALALTAEDDDDDDDDAFPLSFEADCNIC